MPDYTGQPCKDCQGKKSPSVAAELRCLKCKRARRQLLRDRSHESRVGKVYGLDPGDYEKQYEAQDGLCPGCLRATGKTKKLAVEHNHKIEQFGKISVRGLMCGPDNQVIGHARDDPEYFLRMYRYLTSPPAWETFGTREAALAALAAVEDGTWL